MGNKPKLKHGDSFELKKITVGRAFTTPKKTLRAHILGM
jgi:hypothetical protein